MPFGHTSPTPFGGTLPKGEGLGVDVLNNHFAQVYILRGRGASSLFSQSLHESTMWFDNENDNMKA